MTLRYRFTKQGRWVIVGPVDEVKKGPCRVQRNNGEWKTEYIMKLGTPFDTEDGQFVYGYVSGLPRGSAKPKD